MMTPCWTPRRLASLAISSETSGITLACTCPVRGLGLRPRRFCAVASNETQLFPCPSTFLDGLRAAVFLAALQAAKVDVEGFSVRHVILPPAKTLVDSLRKLRRVLDRAVHVPLGGHAAQVSAKLEESAENAARSMSGGSIRSTP
jgi:hypothetical protein